LLSGRKQLRIALDGTTRAAARSLRAVVVPVLVSVAGLVSWARTIDPTLERLLGERARPR
jgi:hypothetical protein